MENQDKTSHRRGKLWHFFDKYSTGDASNGKSRDTDKYEYPGTHITVLKIALEFYCSTSHATSSEIAMELYWSIELSRGYSNLKMGILSWWTKELLTYWELTKTSQTHHCKLTKHVVGDTEDNMPATRLQNNLLMFYEICFPPLFTKIWGALWADSVCHGC